MNGRRDCAGRFARLTSGGRWRPASTSGATSRWASSKPEPTIAPPAARAAMPWQTTASLKNAKAWYQSASETSKPVCARVALDHLGARREALGRGDRRDDPRRGEHLGVAVLAPERQQRAEVGERVAERAHLPVEHGDDAARAGSGAGSCCRAGSRRARSRATRCGGSVRTRSSRSASSAGSSSTFDASHCFDQRRSWRSMKPAGPAELRQPDGGGVDGVQARRARRRAPRRSPRRSLGRVGVAGRAARCGRCGRRTRSIT